MKLSKATIWFFSCLLISCSDRDSKSIDNDTIRDRGKKLDEYPFLLQSPNISNMSPSSNDSDVELSSSFSGEIEDIYVILRDEESGFSVGVETLSSSNQNIENRNDRISMSIDCGLDSRRIYPEIHYYPKNSQNLFKYSYQKDIDLNNYVLTQYVDYLETYTYKTHIEVPKLDFIQLANEGEYSDFVMSIKNIDSISETREGKTYHSLNIEFTVTNNGTRAAVLGYVDIWLDPIKSPLSEEPDISRRNLSYFECIQPGESSEQITTVPVDKESGMAFMRYVTRAGDSESDISNNLSESYQWHR